MNLHAPRFKVGETVEVVEMVARRAIVREIYFNGTSVMPRYVVEHVQECAGRRHVYEYQLAREGTAPSQLIPKSPLDVEREKPDKVS